MLFSHSVLAVPVRTLPAVLMDIFLILSFEYLCTLPKVGVHQFLIGTFHIRYWRLGVFIQTNYTFQSD